jgi:hypothetical protein
VRLAVEQEVAADDAGVLAEAPLPEAVADDGDTAAAGRVLRGREAAARGGADAEEREEVGRHAEGGQPLGLAAVAGEVVAAQFERGHVFEDLVLRFPVGVVGGRGRVAPRADG